MPEEIQKNKIRVVLDSFFLAAGEFEAFCLDYFPKVHKRFTVGMNRVLQTNLLLETTSTTEIVEALRRYGAGAFARVEHILQSEESLLRKTNPYRGLDAFQVEHAHLFFGRDALVTDIWNCCRDIYYQQESARLYAIWGPSGSGKSSLARAGLLARLKNSPIPGPRPMRLLAMRPGECPVQSLAAALLEIFPPLSDTLAVKRQDEIEAVLRTTALNSEANGLRRLLASLPDIASSPLLLLVDQFEEMYTLCAKSDERDYFVNLLVDAVSAKQSHAFVLLTLRSDFLGELYRSHPALARVVTAQGRLIPALTAAEMRAAIIEPALRSGQPLDTATVELLMNEALDHEGSLPLLEYALFRLWEGAVGFSDIRSLGALLAGHAQEIYDRLSDSEQRIARRAFTRMVRLGEGVRDTRRRAGLPELIGHSESEAQVLAVLRAFAGERSRLITLSASDDTVQVEVTHEALFEYWTTLRSWIHASRPDRQPHDHLFEAARLWDQSERPTDSHLWEGRELDELRSFASRNSNDLTRLQYEFWQASEDKARTQNAARRRTRLRLRLALAGAGLGLLIALGTTLWNSQQARQRLMQSYVEQGRQLLQEGDPLRALVFLSDAYSAGNQDSGLPYLLADAMKPIDAIVATLHGHNDEIQSVQYSPDGKYIATASLDMTARVWDAATGQVKVALNGHSGPVFSASYSPDGMRIITASADGTARVWDTPSGTSLQTLRGHTKGVLGAVFSQNGERVLTWSLDGTARIWSASSGQEVFSLAHAGPVNSAIFSIDGTWIATASDDKLGRIFAASDGSLVAELRGHGQEVLQAAFLADGVHAVTLGRDKFMKFWEIPAGGKAKVSVRMPSKGLGGGIAVHRRQSHIAVGGFGLLLFDLANVSQPIELQKDATEIESLDFSPDGASLLVASSDHTARAWNMQSGQVESLFAGHAGAVLHATYRYDGDQLATAGSDAIAKIWKVERDYQLVNYVGHQDNVFVAKFSPDEKMVITASADGTAAVWETASGKPRTFLRSSLGAVGWVEWNPDGIQVATSHLDGFIRLWNARTGSLLYTLADSQADTPSGGIEQEAGSVLWKKQTTTVEFSPNGKRIVTAANDAIARVWDTTTGRLLFRLEGHGQELKRWNVNRGKLGRILNRMSPFSLGASFSPDGTRIATFSGDGTVRLWSAQNGHLLDVLQGHALGLYMGSFSTDGKLLVTPSYDGTARLWDARINVPVGTKRELRVLRGHLAALTGAHFSPDGTHIITSSMDQTARIWDTATGQPLAVLRGHKELVISAHFSPDGRRVLTASYDGTSRIWDAATGKPLTIFRGHAGWVYGASFSKDGSNVLTASSDNSARLWEVRTETRSHAEIATLVRCHVPWTLNQDTIVPKVPAPNDCPRRLHLPSSALTWDRTLSRLVAAHTYLTNGQFTQASTSYQEAAHALQQFSAPLQTAEVLWGLGTLARRRGLIAEAEEYFRRALAAVHSTRSTADSPSIAFRDAISSCQDDKYDAHSALVGIDIALCAVPHDHALMAERVEVLLSLGRVSEVLDVSERAYDALPRDKPDQLKLVLATLAWSAARLAHDTVKERQWGKRLLTADAELDSKAKRSWSFRAAVSQLAQQSAPPAALADVEELVKLVSKPANDRDLATWFAQKGNWPVSSKRPERKPPREPKP